MKKFLRHNGLSVVLVACFLALWLGQAITGHHEYNEEREDLGLPVLNFSAYLSSVHFWEATAENWESEFLQMGAYVLLTVTLVQRGSSESRKPDEPNPQDEDPRQHRSDPDAPWPVKRGGWWLWIYERSLFLAFLLLFLGSSGVHTWAGYRLYNEDQIAHGKAVTDFWGYLGTTRFWFESLQNWQSEFLAVASIVLLSIWLRQWGSPESKPVAAPHAETGK
jgi:hypothetical protein